jgi:hypothetical protein
MEISTDRRGTLRKALLPAAASIAGAGIGLVLTRKPKLRERMPDLDRAGVGDLVHDLRGRVESVLGKVPPAPNSSRSSRSARAPHVSRDELERRRDERTKRRDKRRATS